MPFGVNQCVIHVWHYFFLCECGHGKYDLWGLACGCVWCTIFGCAGNGGDNGAFHPIGGVCWFSVIGCRYANIEILLLILPPGWDLSKIFVWFWFGPPSIIEAIAPLPSVILSITWMHLIKWRFGWPWCE